MVSVHAERVSSQLNLSLFFNAGKKSRAQPNTTGAFSYIHLSLDDRFSLVVALYQGI